MMLTEQLRTENDDVFKAIFNHPFVQGIGKGDLPKEALIRYIKADHGYLTAFLNLYGIAMSKARTREEISFFYKQIDFVLHGEEEPHENFCQVAGVDYESLQGFPLPPAADHYVKHMMYHAHTGNMGELFAVLLPCPWTYFELSKELVEQYKPTPDHPFYDWITFYANPGVVELEMRQKLDNFARHLQSQELVYIRDAFRKSCQLELAFWEMAYTGADWLPTTKEVHIV